HSAHFATACGCGCCGGDLAWQSMQLWWLCWRCWIVLCLFFFSSCTRGHSSSGSTRHNQKASHCLLQIKHVALLQQLLLFLLVVAGLLARHTGGVGRHIQRKALLYVHIVHHLLLALTPHLLHCKLWQARRTKEGTKHIRTQRKPQQSHNNKTRGETKREEKKK